MTIKNIIKKANTLYEAMETKQRGEEPNNKTITILKEGKYHQKLLNLTFKVSEETSLSMDSVYMFVYEVLAHISESQATSIQELEENILDIEPDVYTGELTDWLGENNNHVYYLSKALDEYGMTDGFQALGVAQQMAKQEVAQIVLQELQN